MHEVIANLELAESTGCHCVQRPSFPADGGDVKVVLRVKASEVRRSMGMVTIADGVVGAEDMARAFQAALPARPVDADQVPLVLPGLEASLDDGLSGFGLPLGVPGRQLRVTIPFVTVQSIALAVLGEEAAAQKCRIVSVRVETFDETREASSPLATPQSVTTEDLASVVLWLDGVAKFIDITKARLPDLSDGRTLMMQRFSRHTIDLKNRLREFLPPTTT